MKIKKYLLALGLSGAIALAGCAASPLEPLPTESTSGQMAPGQPGTQPSPGPTTCDIAREAFLTGDQDEINAALRELVADKSANIYARESAQKYLREPNAEIKSMEKSNVQMYCDTSNSGL